MMLDSEVYRKMGENPKMLMRIGMMLKMYIYYVDNPYIN